MLFLTICSGLFLQLISLGAGEQSLLMSSLPTLQDILIKWSLKR